MQDAAGRTASCAQLAVFGGRVYRVQLHARDIRWASAALLEGAVPPLYEGSTVAAAPGRIRSRPTREPQRQRPLSWLQHELDCKLFHYQPAMSSFQEDDIETENPTFSSGVRPDHAQSGGALMSKCTLAVSHDHLRPLMPRTCLPGAPECKCTTPLKWQALPPLTRIIASMVSTSRAAAGSQNMAGLHCGTKLRCGSCVVV